VSRLLASLRYVDSLGRLGRDEERTDPEFRQVVLDLTGRGMVVAGILGMATIGLYTLVYVFVLRHVVCLPPLGCLGELRPGAKSFVMWDEVLVALGCGAVIALGRAEAGKRLGRLIVGCVAVVIGFSLALEDAVAGVSRLATAYAAVVLFITVGTIPFRPVHTLMMSVCMAMGVFLAPTVAAAAPVSINPDNVIFFLVTAAACTGVSTLLYMNRYGQHRARRHSVQAENMASLGRLASGVAHEIENPLNFVINFARISGELVEELASMVVPDEPPAMDLNGNLEEMRDGLSDVRENLRLILRHGERADRIVRLMLPPDPDIDSGVREPVDINRLLEESFSIAHRAFAGRSSGIELTVDRSMAKGLKVNRADRSTLHRAMAYVINNALEAVQARFESADSAFAPTVSLRTTRQGASVVVEVCDNGAGIDPEVGDRVFEPFYTTKPTDLHAGLGLYLAHQLIVDAHGGHISYDSSGGETCFRVSLPVRSVAV
jgi:signal transduction histidine kinase